MASQTPVSAQGSHSRRPESDGDLMEEGQLPKQRHCEISHQDSDEQPREQSCPDGEPKEPVEVDEPKGPDQPAKPIAFVNPMRCEASELTEPAQAAEPHAGRSGQAAEPHAGRSGQAAGHHARRSGQAAEPHAGRSGQVAGHHARRSGQAAEHHARSSGQVQRAYSGRQRQRIERRSYLTTAFQEWLYPLEELVLQMYMDGREGPYLDTQNELSLYCPFTPGPMPVGMVQQPPMVYRYWGSMRHQVFLTYPCMVFFPLVSTGLYFMQPSFVTYGFRPPQFLTYIA